MKILSGDYEVIYSGTIIGIENELYKFEFPKSDGSLILYIKLIKNNGKSTQIEFKYPEQKTLQINIPYANDSGNIDLLRLGSIRGRKLFLNFRLFTISDLSPTLHYTFYLGEEVKDGE